VSHEPIAVIAFNPKTGEVEKWASHKNTTPAGFSYWIIKFDGCMTPQFGSRGLWPGRNGQYYSGWLWAQESRWGECRLLYSPVLFGFLFFMPLLFFPSCLAVMWVLILFRPSPRARLSSILSVIFPFISSGPHLSQPVLSHHAVHLPVSLRIVAHNHPLFLLLSPVLPGFLSSSMRPWQYGCKPLSLFVLRFFLTCVMVSRVFPLYYTHALGNLTVRYAWFMNPEAASPRDQVLPTANLFFENRYCTLQTP